MSQLARVFSTLKGMEKEIEEVIKVYEAANNSKVHTPEYIEEARKTMHTNVKAIKEKYKAAASQEIEKVLSDTRPKPPQKPTPTSISNSDKLTEALLIETRYANDYRRLSRELERAKGEQIKELYELHKDNYVFYEALENEFYKRELSGKLDGHLSLLKKEIFEAASPYEVEMAHAKQALESYFGINDYPSNLDIVEKKEHFKDVRFVNLPR